MTRTRRLAIVAGALFLVTHVTSVVALALYGPVRTRSDYVVGDDSDTAALVGGLLEVVCAMAIVGTAVALFPVVRRYSEAGALGYVGLRTLEAATILVGVVSLLAMVTLHADAAGAGGADGTALVAVGRGLVAVHDRTFTVGPDLVLGTSTVLIAWLLYQARLVPRWIPVLGLVGGPLVFVSGVAVVLGSLDQVSPLAGALALPAFAWELSLALWLLIKGFLPDAGTPGLAGDRGFDAVLSS
jgi:Domain of unknown function (DUF4386)